jgi:hypothetical protein
MIYVKFKYLPAKRLIAASPRGAEVLPFPFVLLSKLFVFPAAKKSKLWEFGSLAGQIGTTRSFFFPG